MYIKELRVKKYRHIESINIGPFPTPGDASELIVFAGPNGGGKSSILELVSIALASTWSLSYNSNRPTSANSFEVTIGLTPAEIKLLEQSEGYYQHGQMVDYLNVNKSYCRAFNFQGGEYDKNQGFHNMIHNHVITTLRGSHSRSLGFHLGSERSYQRKPFDRNKLFAYSSSNIKAQAWSFAFQSSYVQYEDMFEFLITSRFYYTRQLGTYYLQKASGSLPGPDIGPPPDIYGDILSIVFPGYQFFDKDESAPSDLYVKIPSGDVISFSDLSSGEKEVFFTLSFFQRHNVQDAVIIIDEPEVHLHPSLARLLLRKMQDLKPRNQIWLATQSAEVVDEAGRDRVWFVRKHEQTRKAEVIAATEEEPALGCLRDFFGQSGYIGLARCMIFTEGKNSSADRKMFSRLFPHFSREIKFIPAAGCSEVERINRAVLAIIESDLAWCRFILIRDRDYMTDEIVQAIRQKSGQNLYVLTKHEIENYLLDFDILSKVMEEIFNITRSPLQVRQQLHTIALSMAGNVLRDMVAFRLNYRFRPEDFSVPKLFEGKIVYKIDSGWDATQLGNLQATLDTKCQSVVSELADRVNQYKFEEMFNICRTEIENALKSDDWLTLFPGKELLENLGNSVGIAKGPVLQNSVIKELSVQSNRIPTELGDIIKLAIR